MRGTWPWWSRGWRRRLLAAREDDEDVGDLAAGDPSLRSADHEAVAVGDRRGLDRRRVAADVRLGDGDRRQLLAARQPGKPLLLLRARAPSRDGAAGHVIDVDQSL